MKHLDTFSGYGGFTLATENYEKNSGLENNKQADIRLSERQKEEHGSGKNIPSPERHNGRNISSTHSETIGFSEVEPHAIAVLKYHWPHIKNYGDINTINATELPDFDLLTGGSPCQDLSVAGKQAGLSGERSGLFFQYIRLLKEKKPANFIWENVKGTLSSSDGWDFARVQIEMAEAGYSFQWQVLNAKYFGVPQSRERVFVVGHLGNECAGELFFEQEDRGKNLRELTENASQGYRVYDAEGVATTVASQAGGVGAKTGLYAVVDDYNHKLNDSKTIGTVRQTFGNEAAGNGQKLMVKIPEATKQGYAVAEPGDSINLSVLGSKTRRGRVGKGLAQTLDTGMQQYTIQEPILMGIKDGIKEYGTLMARDYKGVGNQFTNGVLACPLKFLDRNQKNYQGDYSFTVDTSQTGGVMQNYRIRRLTPRECERLMGLQDDWTRYGIKPDGLQYELSDSARYKLCGNGVVVNVVKAIISKFS